MKEKNAMMVITERTPQTTQPLRKLIHVPELMKEQFEKQKLDSRKTLKEKETQKRITCSDHLFSERDPATTGPIKSLHLTFNSKILCRDTESLSSEEQNQKKIAKPKLGKNLEKKKPTENTKQEISPTIITDFEIVEPSPADMEKITKKWLHDLNFDTLLTKEKCNLLQDPLRNGTFLCELLETLSGKNLGNVCYNPRHLGDIKGNIECALNPLKRKNIPARYLYNTESILKGDKEVVWGLLYYIMKSYPDAICNNSQHFSKKDSVLYPAEKMKDLEQSILFWLRSLGMLPIHKPIPMTLEDIEEEIRNGTLLCNLVEFILGEPIVGVSKNPKIEATSRSNILKALEPLRNKKRMYQKNLVVDDILNGNKNTILALFEDVRRYYDGIPQRNSKTKSPYLGNYSPLGLGLPHYSFQNIPAIPNDFAISQTNKQSLMQQMMSSTFKETERIPLSAASPTELNVYIPTPTKCCSIEQRVLPEPFFPSSQLKSVFLPSPMDIDKTLTLMNKECKNQINTTLNGKDNETENISMEQEFFEESKRRKHILQWIEKGLGLKLNMETLFEEITNGTKLADIVARCEFSHELKGVEKNPKKSAHKINNVNRALSLLREHKDMTECLYLWSTNDIVNGNSKAIWGLLTDMFSCYCKSKSKFMDE